MVAATSRGPVVSALRIYPIKSTRGISVEAATIERGGFAWDRRWMIVDASGRFVSQRTVPSLARIEVRIAEDALHVRADGMGSLDVPLERADGAARTVSVWDDTCTARSVGDEARAWFTRVVGMECDLVRLDESELRTVDRRYDDGNGRVAFADGYPFLIANEASLADLNARMGSAVTIDRFRPNIVVAGAEAWAEDGWRELQIAGVGFRAVKECARCVVVDVDPTTGAKGKAVLAALATFRKRELGVIFGQNLVHRGQGTVRVGDRVEGV